MLEALIEKRIPIFMRTSFIFAHIPLSVMIWSNCSNFRRLGMCSLQYSSLTCFGINPHTRAKLGLLFNNIYTFSGSAAVHRSLQRLVKRLCWT